MYVGSLFREREKATARVKVLIRRRQRRLEKLELRTELQLLALIDMPILEHIVAQRTPA
jgi:hypothetical protein